MSNSPFALNPIRYRIAPDTHVISLRNEVPGVGFIHMNSMVIAGQEPVVVDTGLALLRDQWLDHIFSVVEPEDIRWIYLSHDDADHVGNLATLLEEAPNAKLVTNWFQIERMSGDIVIDPRRQIWVNDGDSFMAGDRLFRAVRPPIFDSPTTRGLFDTKTGVYWGGDSFASPSPTQVEDASDMPWEAYEGGFLAFQRMISPWHEFMDPARYDEHLTRVQRLPIRTAIGGHGPAVRGQMIGKSFDLFRKLPDLSNFPEPTQNDLDAMIAQLSREPVAA
jgi:flavorubredoxin